MGSYKNEDTTEDIKQEIKILLNTIKRREEERAKKFRHSLFKRRDYNGLNRLLSKNSPLSNLIISVFSVAFLIDMRMNKKYVLSSILMGTSLFASGLLKLSYTMVDRIERNLKLQDLSEYLESLEKTYPGITQMAKDYEVAETHEERLRILEKFITLKSNGKGIVVE